MKYCTKCGNSMDDEMVFCYKCGTRAVIEQQAGNTSYQSYNNWQAQPVKSKKGFKIASIVCAILSCVYLVMGLVLVKQMFLAAIVFGGFAIAFFIMFVSKDTTPQQSRLNDAKYSSVILGIFLVALMPYIGIFYVYIVKPFKKNGTIFAYTYCITMIIGIIFMVFTLNESPGNKIDKSESTTNSELSSAANNETSIVSDNTVKTLSDVKNWFENKKETVASNFVSYLDSQTIDTTAYSTAKITKTKVTETKLVFEKDLGCYYTVEFSCYFGEYFCSGHARGFIEYEGDTINWWSLEIDYKNSVLIDNFDYEYDDYVEEYYNKLEDLYN